MTKIQGGKREGAGRKPLDYDFKILQLRLCKYVGRRLKIIKYQESYAEFLTLVAQN